jgi:addiction module HigA family antidote
MCAAIIPGQGHRSCLAPEAVAEARPGVTAGGVTEAGDARCRRHRDGPAGGAGAPGEIPLEEFLKPLAVSQYRLAKEIGVRARRINEIVHGQRRISAGTALRLARFPGTSERFWIGLLARYAWRARRTGPATRLTQSVPSAPQADPASDGGSVSRTRAPPACRPRSISRRGYSWLPLWRR